MSANSVEIGATSAIAPAAPVLTAQQQATLFDVILRALFTLTIFASASLLFTVQPMVGKILLPKLGGAPAVWNTCMVFFQVTLLLGYLTAHLLSKYASLRVQVVTFACGLMLALQTLPLTVPESWLQFLPSSTDPNVWLLGVLFRQVAPVFLVLSVTSPLLQKWFARSGHPLGDDPYFLYAASNIGSILALLAYPLWLEMQLGVSAQTLFWKVGFSLFMVLAVLCGTASWTGSRFSCRFRKTNASTPLHSTSAISWTQRGRWILLAAVPSSLMLGVTTYISTDVASIPLIWAIPLALYLLTFVLAFSRRQWISAYWMGRMAALLMLAITVTLVTGANDPPTVIVPMHLLMFFTVAMFCHQRLAADRPAAEHLTEFYLCLSIGGMLGGMFNALLAPKLFPVIAEYPLAMIAAAALRETRQSEHNSRRSAWKHPLAFGAAVFLGTLLTSFASASLIPDMWLAQLSQIVPLAESQWRTLLAFGIPACVVLHHLESRSRFCLGLAAILLVSVGHGMMDRSTLERGRNFYGTIRTAREQLAGGEVVKMYHGNTVHGWQWTAAGRREIPLTYYGKSSGVGRLIAQRQSAAGSPLRIGAVGLGAGTLAAAMLPGESLTYYEINPQVLDHAERHFTYLADARLRGAEVSTRLGDARLVLEAEARAGSSGHYDILVVDAFSSDSIPVHLITQECLGEYLRHVTEDGVLAFHITNRYLDLEPVLAALAQSCGLAARVHHHRDIPGGAAIDELTGETTSSWLLLARDGSLIRNLGESCRVSTGADASFPRVWTDDYSNVLGAFQLRL